MSRDIIEEAPVPVIYGYSGNFGCILHVKNIKNKLETILNKKVNGNDHGINIEWGKSIITDYVMHKGSYTTDTILTVFDDGKFNINANISPTNINDMMDDIIKVFQFREIKIKDNIILKHTCTTYMAHLGYYPAISKIKNKYGDAMFTIDCTNFNCYHDVYNKEKIIINISKDGSINIIGIKNPDHIVKIWNWLVDDLRNI